MIFRSFSVFTIVTFGFCWAEKLHLPVPTCKRNITNYSSCLRRSIQEAWPLFAKGLPAEFDFPPLEPFFYKYQEGEFDSGDLHAKISVTNVTLTGFGMARFKAVRPHFSEDTFRLEIDVHIPRIFTDGVSEAHGILAGFRLGGKGSFNITIEGIRAKWDISGPIKNDTWIIEHYRIIPNVKSLEFYIDDNMFDGSREITALVNMFTNEYWPQLYRVIVPIAAEYWDTYFSDLITRFFAKLSFSEVFP